MIFCEVEIEKNGVVELKEKANSLLKNFFILLFAHFSQTTVGGAILDSGGATSCKPYTTNFSSSFIKVGSDNTPVTYDNYNIGNELTGITYGSATRSILSSSSVCAIEVSRTVSETEGIDKLINEIVVFAYNYYSGSSICIDRTVLSSSYTLAANSTVTVKWRLKQTYS